MKLGFSRMTLKRCTVCTRILVKPPACYTSRILNKILYERDHCQLSKIVSRDYPCNMHQRPEVAKYPSG